MKLNFGITMLVTLGVFFGGQDLQANVSLKNGNFFIAYTDAIYSGGFETKLERVYNSKSPYRGMFGWGWGNEFEVYLTVSADGSVVVHEYGGGAENRFNPLAFSASELEKAVDSLAKVAQQEGTLGTAAQLVDYKSRLRADASFRNQQWEAFKAQGKIKARELATGTQLQSNRFNYQYITKTSDGYVRNLADSGRVEKFNNQGHLSKISDKNGNYIAFEYGADGHLKKLVDNLNRKMFFSYNSQGLVSQMDGEGGKSAVYTYNAGGELTQSKDVDGNSYSYRYDDQRRHNMIEIGYVDKTAMNISYYGMDRQENVLRVKDRDGTVTEYDYGSNSANKGNSSVSVVSKKGSEVLSQSKYQYLTKVKPTGEEWTYKLIADFDGDKVETTYSECCGLPLVIKQGSDETQFVYDAKGHVTKKTTPYEVTELHYDQKANKVDRVVKYPVKDKKKSIWSEFQYDSKGNLSFAKNSEGKGVKLIYDGLGRIRTLIDQNKEQINFKYNEISKPIEISDPALGSITVTYNNSGGIKEVSSQAGKKVAAQVTTSFQGLLDIIRPAGVSLAF